MLLSAIGNTRPYLLPVVETPSSNRSVNLVEGDNARMSRRSSWEAEYVSGAEKKRVAPTVDRHSIDPSLNAYDLMTSVPAERVGNFKQMHPKHHW